MVSQVSSLLTSSSLTLLDLSFYKVLDHGVKILINLLNQLLFLTRSYLHQAIALIKIVLLTLCENLNARRLYLQV